MKAVILCGGLGRRLKPFTNVVNKHLALIYDKPLVGHLEEQLRDFELAIVVGNKGDQIKKYFQTLGHSDITWINQGETIAQNTRGIAYAILQTEKFAAKEPLLVVLGDQFAPEFDLAKFYQSFQRDENVRLAAYYNRETANEHTVLKLSQSLQFLDLDEKPNIKSGYTMTGFYLIRPKMYDFLRLVKPNPRTGELEFSDAVRIAAKEGEVGVSALRHRWFDCGTPQNILAASIYASKIKKPRIT